MLDFASKYPTIMLTKGGPVAITNEILFFLINFKPVKNAGKIQPILKSRKANFDHSLLNILLIIFFLDKGKGNRLMVLYIIPMNLIELSVVL